MERRHVKTDRVGEARDWLPRMTGEKPPQSFTAVPASALGSAWTLQLDRRSRLSVLRLGQPAEPIRPNTWAKSHQAFPVLDGDTETTLESIMNAPTTRTSPSPLPLSPDVVVNTVTEDRFDCAVLRCVSVLAEEAVKSATKHLDRLDAERRARFNAD